MLKSTDATLALSGRRILVAEADPHVAEDISRAVERAGGHVVGPLSSAAAVLKILARRSVDGAVIGLKLGDVDMEAVLKRLTEAGSAVVVQTDHDLPAYLPARFPDIPVFSKPSPTDRIFTRLVGSLDE